MSEYNYTSMQKVLENIYAVVSIGYMREYSRRERIVGKEMVTQK